jgi:hypothetical protein
LYGMPGTTVDVAVAGNYAYVADGFSGSYIIDVSDPTNPTLAGSPGSSDYASSVAVAGNYMYLAVGYDSWNGMEIIDISTPASTHVVGQFPIGSPYGYAAVDVTVVGSYAYVIDTYTGLHIINISNSAAPVEAGLFSIPSGQKAVVMGNMAYFTSTSANLRIIDVSTPASPGVVGVYNTLGAFGKVVVAGNYAYTADGNGLRVIDISDPATPILVGVTPTSLSAAGLAVVGNYAYATSDLGLHIVDITNPTAPFEVGAITLPGSLAWDVKVSGNYAYVADYDKGLRVVDISNPASPREVGSMGSYQLASGIAVAGNYAYVAASGAGLRVVDISNPAKPREVGAASVINAYKVAVAGNYAYVTDSYYGGLSIINIADPTHPQLVKFYDLPGQTADITADGNYAYVSTWFSSATPDVRDFIMVDITTATNPFVVVAYNTPGNPGAVTVVGNYLYIADYGGGLAVFYYGVLAPTPTATIPATPTLTATPFPPGESRLFLPLLRRDELVIPTPTSTPTPTYTPTATPPVPACDSYEPNDSRASPHGPLIAGQMYTAKLCTGDPEDNYYFDTTTANPVQLTLTLPPNLVSQAAIWLYAQSNTGITLCGTGPVTKAVYSVSCPIAGAGRYIVRLYTNRPDNAHTYGLQLTFQ